MKQTKIILAFDKFKGSLTQKEAADAAEAGIRAVCPDAEILVLPCADGGEGTVNAFLSAKGGERIYADVTPPHKLPGDGTVSACYGVLNDTHKTCIMEMSASSGLALVPEPERDPMKTSTYGTGELLLSALDRGCKDFLIGIGGSATNDGGAGMAAALGVRFYRADGTLISCPTGGSLSDISRIDLSGIDPRVKRCTFVACCDVDNVLCGPSGAAAVYAPQKGASPETVPLLDRGLSHLADLLEEALAKPLRNIPGAGAAGGLGMGILAFLSGTLTPGIDAVLDAAGADSLLDGADLLLTGEGKVDSQTVCGKTVAGLLRRANAKHVPVIAFGGCVMDDALSLYDAGISAVFSLPDRPMTLDDSLHDAARLLSKQVRAAVSLYTAANHRG